MIGKLINLYHTRPDIAYVVSLVNQFMHSPLGCHMEVVQSILRYLKFTLGKGLLQIEAYKDAN